MKIILIIILSIVLTTLLFAQEEGNENSVEISVMESQRNIIRFGTETEIAALIQTLRNDRSTYLDEELIQVANRTRNRNILTGIFALFGEMERSGLEERALRAISERDYEANETVSAAVDYLGRVRAREAISVLEELVNSGESRFLTASLRALGRVVGGSTGNNREIEETERVAFFLLDYFNNRNPSDDNRREILIALGETGSNVSVSFLSNIVTNQEERPFLRIAALNSLAIIGDEGGMEAVVEAVSSSDPNIRSAAIGALGPFSGDIVDEAILEAFRDSFWRTRVGAAQAAGQRQMISAIPFLRFRAENDDTPQVRTEAIRALGAINNNESIEIVDGLFFNRRSSDTVRLVCGEVLLQYRADTYAVRISAEMEDARQRNQTALYNGFIRMMSTARSSTLEPFTRSLMSTGGVIERSLALDLIMNNEFRGMEEDIRALLDEQRHGISISRKARLTLERLGLSE